MNLDENFCDFDEKVAGAANINFEDFLAQIKHPLLALRFMNEILYNNVSTYAHYDTQDDLQKMTEILYIAFLIKYTLNAIIDFRDLCAKKYILDSACARIEFDDFLC